MALQISFQLGFPWRPATNLRGRRACSLHSIGSHTNLCQRVMHGACCTDWTATIVRVRELMKSWVTSMCGCYVRQWPGKTKCAALTACNRFATSRTFVATCSCVFVRQKFFLLKSCSNDQQRHQTVQCSRSGANETHISCYASQECPAAVQHWPAEEQQRHGRNIIDKAQWTEGVGKACSCIC